MTDLAGYGFVGLSDPSDIGFGALKGPDASDGAIRDAWAESADPYVLTTTPTFLLPLNWASAALERVDSGITVQGVASTPLYLTISVCRTDTDEVWRTFTTRCFSGAPTLMSFPWVINEAPAGAWRWRLKMSVSAGTLTIAPGDASWYIVRLS